MTKSLLIPVKVDRDISLPTNTQLSKMEFYYSTFLLTPETGHGGLRTMSPGFFKSYIN